MIGRDGCQTLARYNRWQNRSLYEAADAAGEAARRAERGAFFGSIHATLAHLLWADYIWFARLDGWEKPAGGIAESARFVATWADLEAMRRIADARIVRWAEGLAPGALEGELAWWSGAAGREVRRPRALLVLHVFNHQTHHRGQVHAMLTAAGARPGDTDLFLMPEDA